MKSLLQGLSNLIAPRVCRICGCTLGADECVLCVGCLMQLPRTSLHRVSFNTIHQQLGHHTPIDRAAAWYYYKRSTPYAKLLVDAKYNHLPALAKWLGESCADELAADRFFEGIDVIVPMPMYWIKRMRRGYNQSLEAAMGISKRTGLPVVEALYAKRSHGVQSHQGAQQRHQNLIGTLGLRKVDEIRGKHVLFFDDIITTGATAKEALAVLSQGNPSRISVLCLGLTLLR